MPPGAAASGPLALNGHSVNPLKAHPSAAATGQRRARRWREGTAGWEGEKRRRTTTSSEKEKCSCKGITQGADAGWKGCYQGDDISGLNQRQKCSLEKN